MPPEFSNTGPPPPRPRRPQSSRTAEPKKPAGRLPTQKQLTSGLTMLVQMAQAVLGGFFPALRDEGYLLSKEEAQLLADALAEEALGHNGFKRAIVRVQQNASHARLMLVVAMLAVPRLMKMGVMPVELDVDPSTFSDLMGTWPTHGSGGTDGLWEVDPGFAPPGSLEILRGSPNETGRRNVPGGGDGEDWESTEPPVSQPPPPGAGVREAGA